MPSSFPIRCGGRQHCLRRRLISEEHSITHYKLKDCLNLWQNEEATSDRHQWPSIRLPLWTPLHCYTANSNYRWRKNIRIQEKSVYTTKLFSGFKSFRIQISHFRFRILRTHDQTGMFSFRIRPLMCKRQNQSGTKTLRIHRDIQNNFLWCKPCLRWFLSGGLHFNARQCNLWTFVGMLRRATLACVAGRSKGGRKVKARVGGDLLALYARVRLGDPKNRNDGTVEWQNHDGTMERITMERRNGGKSPKS